MILAKKFFGLLQLIRPANMLTAIADIWAGFAISGATALLYPGHMQIRSQLIHLGLLSLSTIGLFGGGAMLNDYADAHLNRINHPEKPISAGLIYRKTALVMGYLLIFSGLALAFYTGIVSGFIAMAVAFLVIFYNVYGAHNETIGPLSMGFCRGANLLLGISFIPHSIGFNFIVILIPVIFIAAITSISRYEMRVNNRLGIQLAGWLYLLVIAYLLTVSFINTHFLATFPFIILLFYLAFKPITIAFRVPDAVNIARAVRWGYLSLVVLNAALAAAFSGIIPGIVILILFPVAIFLSRFFALT